MSSRLMFSTRHLHGKNFVAATFPRRHYRLSNIMNRTPGGLVDHVDPVGVTPGASRMIDIESSQPLRQAERLKMMIDQVKQKEQAILDNYYEEKKSPKSREVVEFLINV